MLKNLDELLLKLRNGSVRVSASQAYPNTSSVDLFFANGSKLRADYWRLIKNGKASLSSFDHQQQYGLPAAIDAIKELQKHLHGQAVTDACLDGETGDLLFQFSDDVKLQVFNFMSYEVWEVSFPGGEVEYSNHAKTISRSTG